MTDLAVLALGLGVMPIAAIALYVLRDRVAERRIAIWAFLAGVVGFLGLSHAMAVVLLNHSLFGDEAIATVVSVLGLLIGAGIGWLLLEGPFISTEPDRVVTAAAAFVALHSVGDGLVLGAGFLGGLSPAVRVDAVTIAATVVHRFIEGALIVVPALAARWRSRSAFALLAVSLASVPAAYVPGWIFALPESMATRGSLLIAVPTFVAAVEASLTLVLLVRAFLPLASSARDRPWIVWVVVGFSLITLLHFFVE